MATRISKSNSPKNPNKLKADLREEGFKTKNGYTKSNGRWKLKLNKGDNMETKVKTMPVEPTTFSIAQTAKMIGFPGGEREFFEWLRGKKYFISDNTPSDAYRKAGWFIVAKSTLRRLNPPKTVPVTRTTIKGLSSLDRVVKKEFPICKPCNEINNDK